jgi:hypothetical protein
MKRRTKITINKLFSCIVFLCMATLASVLLYAIWFSCEGIPLFGKLVLSFADGVMWFITIGGFRWLFNGDTTWD